MFENQPIKPHSDSLEEAHDDAYDKTLVELMESEELPLCNCSECSCELIPFSFCIQRAAEKKLGLLPAKFPEVVASRIKGKPLCWKCLNSPSQGVW